jgi:hypothetical protein
LLDDCTSNFAEGSGVVVPMPTFLTNPETIEKIDEIKQGNIHMQIILVKLIEFKIIYRFR